MLGTVDQQVVMHILQALAHNNATELHHLTDSLAQNSAPFAAILEELAAAAYQLSVAALTGSGLGELAPLQHAFSPEDLQLFYQIATHARAELHLAPEESIGFGMALLRMLAFKPGGQARQTSGGNPGSTADQKAGLKLSEPGAPPSQAFVAKPASRQQQVAPAAQNSTAQAPAQIAMQAVQAALALKKKPADLPAQQPQQAPAQHKPAPQATSFSCSGTGLPTPANWPEVSQGIDAKGVVRQALVQSECTVCERLESGGLRLGLRTSVQAYTEPAALQRIEQALTQHWGKPVQVEFSMGEALNTAHALLTQARGHALEAAKEAIDSDPFIQNIREVMGARILEETLRPLKTSGPADI
ncbi:MAG: hypothetical protein HC848_09240 [Limnobacter sp.]|nr:hypothetical protein [Limnobacter sp.]